LASQKNSFVFIILHKWSTAFSAFDFGRSLAVYYINGCAGAEISSSVTAGMYSLKASAQQSRQQGATVQLSHGTALFILPLKVDAKHLKHLKLGLDL